METARIADLLAPFLPRPLHERQLLQLSTYLDLLLRWNQRINLTAVREPENIVTRHFGESLFAASQLFPDPKPQDDSANAAPRAGSAQLHVADIGSGAGFPGIPIKIWAPHIHLTLIESNHKKVAFLREVARAITLTNIDVFAGRAEDFPAQSDVVTLRAVERFDTILPTAARLTAPRGRLALLIGSSQIERASSLRGFSYSTPAQIPNSNARLLLIGTRQESGL